MDKTATKQAAAGRGLEIIPGVIFPANRKPAADEIVMKLGEQVVLKPNDQGSSVGLRIVGSRAELAEALAAITSGNWLVEQRIFGRELAVGVMGSQAMGVVEIRPKSGVYDYESKYTKGRTDYLAPAPFDDATTRRIQRAAETAFAACNCRDYARVDFIVGEGGQLYLLEINTLPGMKETSLLPMSARCAGLDFTALVRELVTPAVQRFRAAASAVHP